MNYAEYQDPRWDAKRAQTLVRCNSTCTVCLRKDRKMFAHHLFYTDDAVWVATDEQLTCLCGDCHREVKKFKMELGRFAHLPAFRQMMRSVLEMWKQANDGQGPVGTEQAVEQNGHERTA